MWSDRYYYINIYHDKNLSIECNTHLLVEFLKSLPELQQTSPFKFTNTGRLPFAELLLLRAKDADSWSEARDTSSQKTNMIAIVCAKDTPERFQQLKATFIKIASFLNWQMVDEENDEGIEDFVLWQPEGNDRLT